MAIFGAQGIRDAMSKSYFHHVEVARQQGTPPGTSLHEFAMYGALASRYAVSFQSVAEEMVWAELAPFIRLQPDLGLKALAEYVVYKEMSIKADIPWLETVVRQGLRMWDEENRQAWLATATAMGFLWTGFVE